MPVSNKEFGDKVKSYRKLAGLSQDNLSEKIGKSREFINKVEAGEKNPSLDTFVDMANVLDVTADQLLGDSIHITKMDSYRQFVEIMEDCSTAEKTFLIQALVSLKDLLINMNK